MYRFDLNGNFSLEIENWIMSDPIIDIWSRKIETPHHGYWQGGYREDSHTKWCELRGAWPFGQSSEEKNQLTRAIAAEEQPKFDLLTISTHQDPAQAGGQCRLANNPHGR